MTYSPSESTRHFHKSVSCSQSLPLRWRIQPRIVCLCKYARHVPELCPQISRPVPLLKCQYHHCRSRRLPSHRACWKSVYGFVMECRYLLIVYFVRRSLRQVQDAKVSCTPLVPMMTFNFAFTCRGRKVTSVGVLYDFTGNDHNTTVQKVEDMVKEDWVSIVSYLALKGSHLSLSSLRMQSKMSPTSSYLLGTSP